jgi:hypothetical protein
VDYPATKVDDSIDVSGRRGNRRWLLVTDDLVYRADVEAVALFAELTDDDLKLTHF